MTSTTVVAAGAVVPAAGLTLTHGRSEGVSQADEVPSMVNGMPCGKAPSSAGPQVLVVPRNCRLLPVVVWPRIETGGAHGPEARVPPANQSSQ